MSKRQKLISSYLKQGDGQEQSNAQKLCLDTAREVVDTARQVVETSRPKAKRTVKTVWFTDFPWLTHDKDSDSLLCQFCVKTRKENVFTKGKTTCNPKRDDLKKHEGSVDHKAATMEVNKLRPAMEKATVNAFGVVKESMLCLFRTVLLMAREGIPSSKASALVKLQIANGCDKLRHLSSKSEDFISYMHNNSLNDIYAALSSVVKKKFCDEVSLASWKYFSIEADEGTDCSNTSILIVYLRFINSMGVIDCKFLGVKELLRTDSESLLNAILTVLTENNLDVNNMVGITTDGASVMQGVHSGVTTRLKEKVPHLVSIHCMAHRLALLSEKAACQVPYFVKYISVLNQFAKTLKFSPKLCRILDNCKSINDEKARRIKQVFFTRWLSFADSVQALSGCFGSVISSLIAAANERNTESAAVLEGVSKQMCTYKFIMSTYFLSDAVGVLGLLSEAMQKSDTDYSKVKAHIDGAVVALQSLLYHDGPYTSIARKLLPADPPTTGTHSYFKTHQITDSASERKAFTNASKTFIEDVTKRLTISYPSTDFIDAFQIFSPKSLSDIENPLEKLQLLFNHYSKSGNTEDELESFSESFVITDPAKAAIEWSVLENTIRSNKSYSHDSAAKFYAKFLHPSKNVYPMLSKLCAVGLLMPTSSANCERAISTYNYIKSDVRGSMSVSLVQNLMLLSLEVKESELSAFNYEQAFSNWVTAKDRRAFAQKVANQDEMLKK